MVADTPQDLLHQFCGELRLLWRQAGGPSLRTLGEQLHLSKSQVSAILNGNIRQLPDWNVVRALLENVIRRAYEQGRAAELSLSTGVAEYWRPRYRVVEYAFAQAGASGRRSGPTSRPQAGGDAARGRVVPRQLPATVRHFAGRRAEMEMLTELLEDSERAGRATVIATIDGTAGVGKTTLAVHWARQVSGRFPDGQLYVNLRGVDPTLPPVTPADALRGFLAAFETPPERIPESLEAEAALYRSVLAGRRVLVLLDNARDVEQVRPLLPGAAGCLVVVTSRNQIAGLVAVEDARPLTLDLLRAAEARHLLVGQLGPERVAAEPAATEEIIARSGRLPLALAIVAARAATHPHFPLGSLAAELRAAGGGLDAFDGGDLATDVRAVFSWSYQTLTSEAARLFRLLGLHPGPDIAASAAASLLAVPEQRVRPLLAELARAHLVAQPAPGRFSLHDLLRSYAAELARAGESEEDRTAALDRMIDHYLHNAHAASRLVHPSRDPIALADPVAGVTILQLDGPQRASSWFTAERAVLLAVVGQASGSDPRTWQLAWAMTSFLDRRGDWQDLAAVQRAALDAARRATDRAGRAHAHRGLGRAYTLLGRYDEAYGHLEAALALFGGLGDVAGRANTHLGLSWVLDRQGSVARALEHSELALELYTSIGHRHGRATALNSAGWCHALLGHYEQALDRCRDAITVLAELDDRHGLAATWDSLGYAHHHLGDHQEAAACYRRAFDLHGALGDAYNQAVVLVHLGDTQAAGADTEAARQTWREAVSILDRTGSAEADDVRAKLERLAPPPTAAGSPTASPAVPAVGTSAVGSADQIR